MTVDTSTEDHMSMPAASAQRLRILHIIDSLSVGGAEQHLVILARHIDTTRFDMHICSLAALRENRIVHDLRALDVPLYSLGGALLRDPTSIVKLVALIRRHNIDIIHTHLGHANIVGPLAGVLTHRPVVSTLHNEREVYPRFGTIKQTMQTQILQRFSRTIIACAPEVRVAALERLRLPAGKLIDIPYGIETDVAERLDPAVVQARRQELLAGSMGPLVVSVGNLKAAKAHEYLVSATRLVMERVPDVKVAIVGRTESHEPVVRARIAELGLEERVVLTGLRQDVAELVAAADLFVLSSAWEGLPLALLEAMVLGSPVVSTAVGGIARVVEDGVTGRLVPPSNVQALADAMIDMLCNPEEAQRLGAAGRARVHDIYGADAFARRVEHVYEEVAAGRSEVPV